MRVAAAQDLMNQPCSRNKRNSIQTIRKYVLRLKSEVLKYIRKFLTPNFKIRIFWKKWNFNLKFLNINISKNRKRKSGFTPEIRCKSRYKHVDKGVLCSEKVNSKRRRKLPKMGKTSVWLIRLRAIKSQQVTERSIFWKSININANQFLKKTTRWIAPNEWNFVSAKTLSRRRRNENARVRAYSRERAWREVEEIAWEG